MIYLRKRWVQGLYGYPMNSNSLAHVHRVPRCGFRTTSITTQRKESSLSEVTQHKEEKYENLKQTKHQTPAHDFFAKVLTCYTNHKGFPSKGLPLTAVLGPQKQVLTIADIPLPFRIQSGKITLPKVYEQLMCTKEIPSDLKCALLSKSEAIEEFARSSSSNGLPALALCAKILTIAASSQSAKTIPCKPDNFLRLFAFLWFHGPQKGLYFSIPLRMRSILYGTAVQRLSYRELRALLLTHFPPTWVPTCAPEMLSRATDYSLAVCSRSKAVFTIDWNDTMTKVTQIIEEEFQKSVATLPTNIVLSRKIPLDAFGKILARVIPAFPKCMPADFSLAEFIAKNFHNRFTVSLSSEHRYDIEPVAAQSVATFEANTVKFLQGQPEGSSKWASLESACASMAKGGKPVQPMAFGAKRWLDLLNASSRLEYTVTIAVREKGPM